MPVNSSLLGRQLDMNTDPGPRLLSSVARLNRWATRYAELPLPAAQARLLVLIEQLGSGRIGELAELDHCSQPTMTTQVQRLERAGLVSRRGDPTDGRATVISLTSEGTRVLAVARRERSRTLAPVFAELDATQLEQVESAITLLDDILARGEELHAKVPKP